METVLSYLDTEGKELILLGDTNCDFSSKENDRVTDGNAKHLSNIYNIYSTARKSGNISSHTGKLFSSDTRQSMKRRIATERLSKIYIARCGYTWLDESKWPQEWPISPITITSIV